MMWKSPRKFVDPFTLHYLPICCDCCNLLYRPGTRVRVRRHSAARFRNCSGAAPLQRLCTVSRARPGGRTAEHGCSLSPTLQKLHTSADITAEHACSCTKCVTNTALHTFCTVAKSANLGHICRLQLAGITRLKSQAISPCCLHL